MAGEVPSVSVEPGGVHDRFRLVGTILDRKYRVDRVVAEGGYGIVYVGHHLALDVKVAIKVLKPARSVDPDQLSDLMLQFLEEARTLARLRHPSVVAVLDSGVTRSEGAIELPWMVLEWLEGMTLAEDLAARRGAGGRTPAESMAILRPVIDAIAHVHEASVVHRDLKPSNVMLVPAAQGLSARVLDFGIAKLVEPEVEAGPTGDTLTRSTHPAFTMASAAPEQVAGTRTGPWTDVFALALMLTELLVDAPPVVASDPTVRAAALFADDRPTPRAHGIDVGAWEPVLARALAVRPADRPPNARALLGELERALADARHVVVADARRRRRRWWPLPAVVGVAAVAVGGGVALSPGHRPSGPDRPALAANGCTRRGCVAAHGGQPFVCSPDDRCVGIASVDCTVHAEADDLTRDDTIWIGLMAPGSSTEANAAELARRDLASIPQISPTGPGGAPRRRIALVACDDVRDPRAVARHLVNDVRVPAIIGFGTTQSALDLLASEIMPRGVVTMVSRNTSSQITEIPMPAGSPRLVWRTTNSTAQMAHAIAAFSAASLEPRVVRERGHPMTIALVRPMNSPGMSFSDAFVSSLRFADGRGVADSASRFLEVVAAPPGPSRGGAPDDLARLAAFDPDVVVYFGSDYMPWLLALEAPRRAGHPPIYVSALPFNSEALPGLPLRNGSLRARMFALTTPASTPTNAKFTLHFNAVFDDKISLALSPNTTYDAVFALAYAAAAVAPAAVTGERLAVAIPRLLGPGPRIEVGPAQVLEALGALDAGGRIDLDGAGTKLDFDPRTGESPTDHVVLCIGTSREGRPVGVESGLIWDARLGEIRGALECP